MILNRTKGDAGCKSILKFNDDHHLGHVLELTAGWMYGYPEAASQDNSLILRRSHL